MMLLRKLQSSTRAAVRQGRAVAARLVPDCLVPYRRLIRTVLPYTMVKYPRLKNLYRLSVAVNRAGVPGDVVECGVCNGGTAAILASVALRSALPRRLWLFDSFQGLPAPTEQD